MGIMVGLGLKSESRNMVSSRGIKSKSSNMGLDQVIYREQSGGSNLTMEVAQVVKSDSSNMI